MEKLSPLASLSDYPPPRLCPACSCSPPPSSAIALVPTLQPCPEGLADLVEEQQGPGLPSEHTPSLGQLAEMLQRGGTSGRNPVGMRARAIREHRPYPSQCPHPAHVPTEPVPCKKGRMPTPSPQDSGQGARTPSSNPTVPLMVLCPSPLAPFSVSSSVNEAHGGLFVCFFPFRATPEAYGGSQARGLIRATATATSDPSHVCNLHHSSQ